MPGNFTMPSNGLPQSNPPTTFSSPPANTSSTGKHALEKAITDAQISSTLQDRIPYMFTEQGYKQYHPNRRLTISYPGAKTFTAHLDPNDVTRTQQKRVAQLDVLTGVIIQDFGYKAEVLDVKGSTGARYYKAIQEMDEIFNVQNLGKPAKVGVTLEGVDYQAIWTQFAFNRTINPQAGNVVQYSMQFVIFSRSRFDLSLVDVMAANTPWVTRRQAQVLTTNSSGKDKVTEVPWSGSINGYIYSIIGPVNYATALSFIQQYWDKSQGPVPNPAQPLKPGQHLTVPQDWKNVSPTPTDLAQA